MSLLTRNQILGVRLPHLDVDVPEWGGTVRIQQMSVDVRTRFLEMVRVYENARIDYDYDQQLPANKRKGLEAPQHLDTPSLGIVLCMIDGEGKPILTVDEVATVNTFSFLTVRDLWQAVLKLNGFNDSTSEAVEVEKKG